MVRKINKMAKIKLFDVHHPKNIGQKIEKIFKSGVITEGKYSLKFEKKICEFLKNPNCVLVNSGTSALTLAYRLANIQINDEVVVTPLTCMATNQPLDNLGAKLKFVDVNYQTGNVDTDDLKKKVTKNTKCISLVHWAGQPFEIKEVKKISRKYNIPIIEDAAHSFGASYEGKLIGNHGNFCIFSFQAIKHLTTGDGGILVCPNKKIAQRARKLRWYGLNRNFKGNKWKQDILESGYKFHMNNINAIIGLEQLKYIRKILKGHINNGMYYDKKISNPKVKLFKRNNSISSYWIYSLIVDDKRKFKNYLTKHNIESDEVHVRNDKYSVFKKYFKDNLKGVDYIEKYMINIPSGWWLSKKDVKYIVKVVNSYSL